MSEKIFKDKLFKIGLANNPPKDPPLPPNTQLSINKSFTSNLHDISIGVTAAAESIEKTKVQLLAEAQHNPALKLLLYRTDNNGVKILRKWSEMLFRLSIAQHLIQMCLAGKTITEHYIQNIFPEINRRTLKHILNAVKISTSPYEIDMKDVLHQLVAEPERYERLNKWETSRAEYIEIMIRGFLNCHLVLSSPAYRLRKQKKIFVVEDKENNFGIYTEQEFDDGRIINKLNYLNQTLSLDTKHNKKVMDKLKIYGPRESMLWFINETMNTLMFDFDWEDCTRYAVFVYNTLCRI